ncbi:MAG TPA: hypothetical protein VFJ16_20485 [Longimicrobium sp.]|nr:hypothetical protein [Longimicrobium sp.]
MNLRTRLRWMGRFDRAPVIVVPAVLIALFGWYEAWLVPSRAVALCRHEYLAAHTAGDTSRVDELGVGMRPGFRCGEFRRLGSTAQPSRAGAGRRDGG